MKDKDQIVANWLPRYTGVPLDGFGEHVLVTNFGGYLGHFSRLTGAEVVGLDRPMPSAAMRPSRSSRSVCSRRTPVPVSTVALRISTGAEAIGA